MINLPFTSSDLIRRLDQEFPERCPSVTLSDREIWFYAGKRELVRGLLAQLKAQEEEDQGTDYVFSQET